MKSRFWRGRTVFPVVSSRVSVAFLSLAIGQGCYGTPAVPRGRTRATAPPSWSRTRTTAAIRSIPPYGRGKTAHRAQRLKNARRESGADGVCCDKNCSAVCQACDLPATKGVCSPVISQEENACRGLKSCDTTGACTDRFTEFPTPTAASGPVTIMVGADGNLWFTESAANKIGRLSRLGVIDEYSIPTAASFPVGIASGPDQNIWFTEASGDKIGRVVVPGIFTEFTIPTPNSAPVALVTGADNKLWFIQNGAGSIGALNANGAFDEPIAVPNARYLVEITATPNGDIWFTEGDGNRIGRIASGVVTMYPIPTANTVARAHGGSRWAHLVCAEWGQQHRSTRHPHRKHRGISDSDIRQRSLWHCSRPRR